MSSEVLSVVRLAMVALFAILILLTLFNTFRYIPNSKIGIVEKLWSLGGSVRSGLIALHGEAGFQPELLRGGWHLLMPFQYRIHMMPLVTVPQGRIGYLFARDGQPLAPTQALASNVTASDFQDAASFLRHGGQKGPQRQILREGTYAINLAQFAVITSDRLYYLSLDRSDGGVFTGMAQVIMDRQGFEPVVIKGADDLIGVVTVHEGPSLPPGQIIAPTVGESPAQPNIYHNSYQDPERFLARITSTGCLLRSR